MKTKLPRSKSDIVLGKPASRVAWKDKIFLYIDYIFLSLRIDSWDKAFRSV